MQDLAALPPPLQWHRRLTFFLFLFLPPPASYQTATEPRSPQSGSGPGLGRRPRWGCARTGDVPMLGYFLSGLLVSTSCVLAEG